MGTFKAIKLERYLKIFLNNRGDYKLCDLTRRDTALVQLDDGGNMLFSRRQ